MINIERRKRNVDGKHEYYLLYPEKSKLTKLMVDECEVLDLILHKSGRFLVLYRGKADTRYFENVMKGLRGYSREEWVQVDEYLVDEEKLEEGLYKTDGGEEIELKALFDKNGKLLCKGIKEVQNYNAERDEYTLTLVKGIATESRDTKASSLWCVINGRGEYVIPPSKA